jgi:hypothetical protein
MTKPCLTDKCTPPILAGIDTCFLFQSLTQLSTDVHFSTISDLMLIKIKPVYFHHSESFFQIIFVSYIQLNMLNSIFLYYYRTER